MIKINKFDIKVIEKNDVLGSSRLEFKISGKNIDYVVVNTIRRTIMSEIPMYAFNEFKFDKNTSIFHNNYMKLRLRQMPVWGIENTIDFVDYNQINNKVEDTIQEGEEQEDDIELEVEKSFNSTSLKQLNMFVNYKNKTNDIVTVTTNDAKFYYEEKQIQSPYKIAIPLVKLQPNQEISFSAITKLGTEQEDAMYSAICIAGYKQINDNEFNFFLESRGQNSEKRILLVALINIERRIRKFLKLLQENKITEDDEHGQIIVNNEDNTLGNLISRGMQQHNKITFAGYNLPHPLAKKVMFHYKLVNGGKIKNVIEDVVEYYSELFNNIQKFVESQIR